MENFEDTQKPQFNKFFRRLRVSTAISFSELVKTGFGLVYVVDFLTFLAESIKKNLVYKLYWGRGVGYRQFLHVSVFALTLIIFFSGVSYRLFGLNGTSLIQAYSTTYGNVDLLEQGGNITTIVASNPKEHFKVNEYTVASGDNLGSIANKFKVTKQTVKDSNRFLFGTFDRYRSEQVNPGDKLDIPDINGVIYEVQPGDNLDSVVNKTSGDRFQIIELNQLQAPDFSLNGIGKILVPNGTLPAPTPTRRPVVSRPTNPGIVVGSIGGILRGIGFSNPLSDPACGGYVWMRGFIPGYHDGVDLSKRGGCPERAACSGTVTVAYWADYLSGNTITIDCGSGVKVIYYHGNGTFYVRVGDHVQRGQPVQYMGCSGNCTGTHLHVTLKVNGFAIDPTGYIPY